MTTASGSRCGSRTTASTTPTRSRSWWRTAPDRESVEVLAVAFLEALVELLHRHRVEPRVIAEHLGRRGQPGQLRPTLAIPEPRALHALRTVEEGLLHRDRDGQLRCLAVGGQPLQPLRVAHDVRAAVDPQ